MNAQKLTAKQKQALDVYNGLYTALGYPPSIREFKEAYGVYSNSTAFSMLSALRKLGFKCLTRGQARNPGQRSAVFSMGDADQTVELNRLRKICAELVDENEGLKVELFEAKSRARDLTSMLEASRGESEVSDHG